jgi:cytosine/adenosine deaminase-related metal-dependent hydrolase
VDSTAPEEVIKRLNINRLSSNNTNKIIVIIAIFSLSVVITGTFYPFEQGKAASAQQQINNNNNNNPYLPLSMLSTATGTGAAATGLSDNSSFGIQHWNSYLAL